MDAIPQDGSFEPPQYASKPIADISSGTYIERGNLLVAKITPSFENGKQALIETLPDAFGYATTEVIPLRPKSADTCSRLAFYYLLHPEVRSFVAERMEGSTGRQRVPEDVLLGLPYPKPPSDLQASIAGLLREVQRAIKNQTNLIESVPRLKQSAMSFLFASGIRGEALKRTSIGDIPKSWHPRSLVEICNIQSGGTPRKSNADFWKGDIPWVSGKDLKRPALDDAQDHVTKEAINAGSRLAPKGTVLLLVRGMGLAKDLPVAVINRDMAFNQDIKALVPKGEFSGAFIRSAIYAGKERLLSQIVPSAHGTMTLNLNDVENFQVACPADPDEATEIAEILGALDTKIELHRKKRRVLEELFKALLHKLMTGEIDVNDLDLSALQPAH